MLFVPRETVRRFVAYTAEFAAILPPESRGHILLKRHHSLRVLALTRRIVRAEKLTDVQTYACAALLHDIGRFSQYQRFGTFRDDLSVDHGEEGARVLDMLDFATGLSYTADNALREAVRQHNKRHLPENMDPLAAAVCHVVRDADKLDIIPVLLSHMQKNGPRDAVLTLGLPEVPDAWSPEIYAAVAALGCPAYASMRVLNDFALLLASWGPTLHHAASRQIFRERGYLQQIFALLPADPTLRELEKKLSGCLVETGF